ncbi:hypothetical protein BZZ01_01275 [Nostocales cyanobacterium HT-58-2]|nr:hypothetical protein BZZ01_01275 [Nostocales cyanobacterium HT-58-2]
MYLNSNLYAHVLLIYLQFSLSDSTRDGRLRHHEIVFETGSEIFIPVLANRQITIVTEWQAKHLFYCCLSLPILKTSVLDEQTS